MTSETSTKDLADLPHVTIPEDYASRVGPFLAECYAQHETGKLSCANALLIRWCRDKARFRGFA